MNGYVCMGCNNAPAWPTLQLGDIDGVLKEKPLQFSESNLGAVEELGHLPATHDRQNSHETAMRIEAGQHTLNTILVFVDEFFHSSMVGPITPAKHRGPSTVPHT